MIIVESFIFKNVQVFNNCAENLHAVYVAGVHPVNPSVRLPGDPAYPGALYR